MLLGFGFKAAFPLMLIMSLIIFIYNYKELGFNLSIILVIMYQVIFDSEAFLFSSAQFRFWYLLLIILFVKDLWLKPAFRVFKFDDDILILCFLFILSFSYAFIQPLNADAYIIKYWAFYVGLIYKVYMLLKGAVKDKDYILDFIIQLGILVAVWGFVQMFYAGRMFLSSPFYDPTNKFDIRPPGFFSETTWYSEFLFFCGLLALLRYNIIKESKFQYMTCLILFAIGIIISITRNTYVAVGLIIILAVVFNFKMKILINRSAVKITFWITVIVVFLIVLQSYIDFTFISSIIERFTNSGSRGNGRLRAISMTIDDLSNSGLLWGQGFSWDPSQATDEGNAIGAKSFNLFFMMLHIFGVLGFIPFMILIIRYYVRVYSNFKLDNNLYALYSLFILSAFLQMSMFAPIHQYPFGMVFVAVSLILSFWK